ncbi:hypothetical protein [uncultured Rikenella sp.]|uniref:hypothetical protein n=1 Tax=uncultured Rikenella sp. TaxID=368003 RepID=UPI00261F0F6C|nr:hypothetical protein [uncultured Rikenella sp.]
MPLGINGGKCSAPGLRGGEEGFLWHTGNGGYSYSASMNQQSGLYLRFMMNASQPSHSYHSADGFQLRCLSE